MTQRKFLFIFYLFSTRGFFNKIKNQVFLLKFVYLCFKTTFIKYRISMHVLKQTAMHLLITGVVRDVGSNCEASLL